MTKHMKGSKKQKIYRMKGCSKNTRKNKNYLGGSADVNLAYPSSNVTTISNTNLAYNPATSVRGGGQDISRAYPSKGPASNGFNFLNSNSQNGGANSQNGGGCGCGLQLGGNKHRNACKCSQCKVKMLGGSGLSTGGVLNGASNFSSSYSCSTDGGCTDNAGLMGGARLMGGNRTHRNACSCSSCKSTMKGGSNVNSNNGLPYPNGLLGEAWTPSVAGWPGVDGISMNRNHLGYNTYAPNDVSRQMIDTGASPPFLGGKRGSKSKKRRSQKGGVLSNFITQDLINLGRQFQFNAGSSYNAIKGYASPINPMPWKDQMTHKSVQLP